MLQVSPNAYELHGEEGYQVGPRFFLEVVQLAGEHVREGQTSSISDLRDRIQ